MIRFRRSLLIHAKNFVADSTAKSTANAEILIYFCCFHKITYICQFYNWLKYNDQKHLERFLSIYRVRVPGWHDDGFPFMQQIFCALDGDFPNAVQTGNESVTARFMGADLLALCE